MSNEASTAAFNSTSSQSVVESQRDVSPAKFWNVPNSLTVVRLVLSFVTFALIQQEAYHTAVWVFVIASLTDALDGYFARLLKQESQIGRQLDPFVDKVINVGALIFLLPISGTGLKSWMVATIVLRELMVQALRSLIEGRGHPFGARAVGKLKTVFQCASIIAILVVLALRVQDGRVVLLRDLFTWTAVALTFYSGLVYLVLAWPEISTASRRPST